MVAAIKDTGMQSCATLGMLDDSQAAALKEAGLDYYNHNLDTSREYYPKVVSTRSYDDRIDTLTRARRHGIKLCSGGIIGMGEQRSDRVNLIAELALLQPESVPINHLVGVDKTPLGNQKPVAPLEFVRTVAVSRILMPQSYVRISAGRDAMSTEHQTLCFLAGANSLFLGDTLLTVPNAKRSKDKIFLKDIGISHRAVAG